MKNNNNTASGLVKWATPLVLMFLGSIMIISSYNAPMWVDEYAFYRLSSQLPNYSTSMNWFYVDRPEMLHPSIEWEDRDEAFRHTYDTPIYGHTPLAPAMVYPLVKSLNLLADAEVIPHIEEQPGIPPPVNGIPNTDSGQTEVITFILRLVTIGLTLASMWLIFKILRAKIKDKKFQIIVPILAVAPIATSMLLLTGTYLLYWDAFMMFFFLLTLYTMEAYPNSKWKYVTACCLVNTKIFLGIAFLLPLVVHAFTNNKGHRISSSIKMMLPALSIIPFYLATYFVTGDWLYIVKQYLNGAWITQYIYSLFDWTVLTTMGMPLYLLLTAPVLLFIKKYPACATYWIMVMIYSWGTGLGITQISNLVYSGALAFPIVAYELKIMERIRKHLPAKKEVAEKHA